jgi:hypothetical protein
MDRRIDTSFYHFAWACGRRTRARRPCRGQRRRRTGIGPSWHERPPPTSTDRCMPVYERETRARCGLPDAAASSSAQRRLPRSRGPVRTAAILLGLLWRLPASAAMSSPNRRQRAVAGALHRRPRAAFWPPGCRYRRDAAHCGADGEGEPWLWPGMTTSATIGSTRSRSSGASRQGGGRSFPAWWKPRGVVLRRTLAALGLRRVSRSDVCRTPGIASRPLAGLTSVKHRIPRAAIVRSTSGCSDIIDAARRRPKAKKRMSGSE